MTVRRAQPWLGTFVEIEASCNSQAAALCAIDAAFTAVANVHWLMSRQQACSDVQRINRAAVAERVAVHRWTARVLLYAREISRESGGTFDVVVPEAVTRSRTIPTWRDLHLVQQPGRSDRWFVCKRRPLRISLDGIAKGFAVDRAVSALRRGGVQAGIVNAGGDLRCFGAQRFRIAIRKPDPEWPAPVLAFDVCNRAVATSGGYFGARFWNKASEGTVTIVARSAMLADALTKAIRGSPQHRRPLLKRYRARGWVDGSR